MGEAGMVIAFLLLLVSVAIRLSSATTFLFNGFQSSDHLIFLQSSFFDNGQLSLTRNGIRYDQGRILYPTPLTFKDAKKTSGIASFSSTFIFSIQPGPEGLAQGMAFLIAPNANPVANSSGPFLGLFNRSSNGNPSGHTFAIELDTYRNPEFGDRDENHVGIDMNGINSTMVASPVFLTSPAFLSSSDGYIVNLRSGQANQIWIDYDGDQNQLNISISRNPGVKPPYPFFSNSSINLSSVLQDNMFIGFSASTANLTQTNYFILAWSFSNEGGPLPNITLPPASITSGIKISLSLTGIFTSLFVGGSLVGILLIRSRRRKRKEKKDNTPNFLEGIDLSHSPQRLTFKELRIATKGYSETNLLGRGGFGSVYRGVLLNGTVVAVKQVSKDSRQGMKEFVAELSSIGRLRHRHLVPLLGWCPERGLALVYEYMPNGSLDMYLFVDKRTTDTSPILTWMARCKILQGVASALVYLHEECEQKIIHRDVKASNVLLDAELNARLGDFGLARLYDHDAAMTVLTTDVAGTFGYLAPEYLLTRKFTEKVDVYSFGALVLEVVSGRRIASQTVDLPLLDWLWQLHSSNNLVEAIDSRLMACSDCKQEAEIEMLRLGMLCLHPDSGSRPSMRRVLQVLTGDAPLPSMPVSRPPLVISHFSLPLSLSLGETSPSLDRTNSDYHELPR